MKKLLFAALAVLALFSAPASAQEITKALIVSSCGTLPVTYVAGTYGILTMDTNGKLCDGSSGGSTTSNQGTKGTNAQAWWVEIGDGTNGPVTVKPASTAPAATDSSLVVGINPNSINANGQATRANSAPVTIASDQYGDACASGVVKSSVAINITSATTTQLVAISGSTAIYICGFSFTISEVVTTPNTLQFEYGTSTNCTGTNKLTGLYGGGGVTAGDPIAIAYGNGNATVFSVPASNGLCALTAIGASASFQGVLTYVQQ